MKLVAAQRKVQLVDSTVAAEISIVPTEAGGLALNAALRVHIGGGLAVEVAESLTAAAHEVCPYSVATHSNVPVTLTAA